MKKIVVLITTLLMFSCNGGTKNSFFNEGVSAELARHRKSLISDLIYDLRFEIPLLHTEPLPGSAVIHFTQSKRSRKPLLIDFRVPDDHLFSVTANGTQIEPVMINGHIIIPATSVKQGKNSISLSFRTGELSLNRNEEYLYTLLVPDRAATAFPCFDQPDLKAKFRLTLTMPPHFEAISNNPVISNETTDTLRTLSFADGEPISTYLFAFAAGKFERIVRQIEGVEMEMLHREPSSEVVERNADEIFRLHYHSLKWMEEYTGISYPFPKFGFILIPAFQYGGMEHPGAIYYRSSSLMLDDSPTMNNLMSRASLIAHETSHIWFGDLVTMKWFDDVWLKEVFAGYMADKIVNPDFPEANHDLRFLLNRYSAAYAVDRTRGANPIIQELSNLRDAGSLYGGIIYNKAPVVMKHLEMITGDSLLRGSLRLYLERYSYDNANWDDLISVIGEVSGINLREWSHVWVREEGMPTIETLISENNGEYHISFLETDRSGREREWPQQLNAMIIVPGDTLLIRTTPSSTAEVAVVTTAKPLAVIPDIDGTAYGFFKLDKESILYLLNHTEKFDDPLQRGIIWLNLWENMLHRVIAPDDICRAMINASFAENNEQLLSFLTSRISSLFANHISEEYKTEIASGTEAMVLMMINSAENNRTRRIWYNLYTSLATTSDALERMYRWWNNKSVEGKMTLSEQDLIPLSFTLAIKDHPKRESLLQSQENSVMNPDRLARYRFVKKALADNQTERDNFFESLRIYQNRITEPWVTEALGYLHHPIVAQSSVHYIKPSLELLEEIKYTGDIFFPAGWITNTLGGHRSREAYEIVEAFLRENPDYPHDLRLKILQASDHLYRLYGLVISDW